MFNKNDKERLRALAERYAEAALGAGMREREARAKKINGLGVDRPLVNVFEVPWGELDGSPDLTPHCVDERARGLEYRLLQVLYQKEHFMADYTLPPYFSVPVVVKDTGFGLSVDEDTIDSISGSSIRAHAYYDQIPDIESLQKIQMPTPSLDGPQNAANLEAAHEAFDGILPIRQGGVSLYSAMWDIIPVYHSVQKTLDDLVDDPDYSHAAADAFTRYFERLHTEYERLGVLEVEPYYLHCTPALTDELPAADFDGEHVRQKDVWARGMAQIFAVVSPQMHDEFDLQYMQRLFDPCGLSYYGCCEPLDRKIGLLRKRFKNLRKISITPWADPERAASEIGGDYVFSYKPNPAFVAGGCDIDAVAAELRRVLEACRRHNTPCEITLKDISTVSGDVRNLTAWVGAANRAIDEFFS
ncbi:MAG: hypothetical protein FWH01_11980 [Oscillospiraceae bacterium]|nr:hypothetical protein [Oscillospiraceae bacterium]